VRDAVVGTDIESILYRTIYPVDKDMMDMYGYHASKKSIMTGQRQHKEKYEHEH
jgi:hypothetical protein